jgi:hypothetical protein
MTTEYFLVFESIIGLVGSEYSLSKIEVS